MKNLDMTALIAMTSSPIKNYILAGLESRLLGATTRIFRNSRESSGIITPHSHRFDFQCLVLEGSVVNSLFVSDEGGDLYQVSNMDYQGEPGEYETSEVTKARFLPERRAYEVGEWYGMQSDEIHSVAFSRDAVVLFIEGAEKTKRSYYIEPIVGDVVIKTMKSEPWMFLRC